MQKVKELILLKSFNIKKLYDKLIERLKKSKSAQKALRKYNSLSLTPEGLPKANDLDNATTPEAKAYKRLASCILRLADASWWASAPKTKEANKILSELILLVNEGYRIDILSSPFEEESIKGKLKWCNKNLPKWLFTHFHIRGDKENFADSNSLLIDDREKVCKKFSEKGGHTVLYNNDWLTSLREALKNNNITNIYVDLDGVLVDTHSQLIQVLKNLKKGEA